MTSLVLFAFLILSSAARQRDRTKKNLIESLLHKIYRWWWAPCTHLCIANAVDRERCRCCSFSTQSWRSTEKYVDRIDVIFRQEYHNRSAISFQPDDRVFAMQFELYICINISMKSIRHWLGGVIALLG